MFSLRTVGLDGIDKPSQTYVLLNPLKTLERNKHISFKDYGYPTVL